MRTLSLSIACLVCLALAAGALAAPAATEVKPDPKAAQKVAQHLAIAVDQKKNETQRRNALAAMADPALIHETRKHLDKIVPLYATPNIKVVWSVRDLFVKIGPDALPYIERAMADPKTERGAVDTLVSMGQLGKTNLIGFLTHEDAAVRTNAAIGLGKIARNAQDAVPALTGALNDKSEFVRAEAAISLGLIGAPADAAVPTLVERLNDATDRVRIAATEALGKIGKASEPAVASLGKILADAKEDMRLRRGAADALGGIGAKGAPALMGMLASDDEDIRWSAAKALGNMPAEATDTVVAGLRSDNVAVRRYSAFALAKMGEKAASAVLPLTKALRDGEAVVRRNAADALGRMGKAAAPAADALCRLLDEKYHGTCLAAVRSLGRLKVASSVGPIKELLKTSRAADTKRAACMALANMGADAAPAIPALAEAEKDEYASVRWAATQALAQIQGAEEKQ